MNRTLFEIANDLGIKFKYGVKLDVFRCLDRGEDRHAKDENGKTVFIALERGASWYFPKIFEAYDNLDTAALLRKKAAEEIAKMKEEEWNQSKK